MFFRKNYVYSFIITFLCGFFTFSEPGFAEYVPQISFSGTSGLIFNGTPATLKPGAFSVMLHNRFERFFVPDYEGFTYVPSKREVLFESFLSGGFGIWKGMEAGFQIPLEWVAGATGKTGIGTVFLYYKYTPLPLDSRRFALGMRFFLGVPPGFNSTQTSAGTVNGGAEIYFTAIPFENRNVLFHAGIGAGYEDYYHEGSSPSSGMRGEARIKGFAGVQYFFTPALELIGELSGWRVFSNTDDNLTVSAGLRYRISNGIVFSFSAGGGVLGAERSNEDVFVTFSIGYFFGRQALAAEREVVEEGPRIAVLNACSKGNARKHVVRRLKKAGLKVKYVGLSRKDFRNFTAVLFNREHIPLAKKIARILPHKQRLVVRKKPDKKGTVKVYAGCDQLPDWKPEVPNVPPKYGVFNACRKGPAGDKVSEILLKNGYDVKFIKDTRYNFKDFSVIVFNKNHLPFAKRIAGLIPGRQRLQVRKIPRDDGLISIYAGCDQLEIPRRKRKASYAVLNSCDMGDATVPVATLLIKNGYEISYVGESKQKFRDYSLVLYNPEHEKEAQKLQELIPGDQVLIKRKKPRPDGLVVIYAGCDQITIVQEKKVKKVPREEISIRVLNACGRPGLASETGKKLILAGFMNLVEVGNARQRGLPSTLIYYQSPYEEEAREILKLLGTPQGRIMENSDLSVMIEINVGCDVR